MSPYVALGSERPLLGSGLRLWPGFLGAPIPVRDLRAGAKFQLFGWWPRQPELRGLL